MIDVVVIQWPRCVRLCDPTVSQTLTISQSLSKFMSTELVTPSNHLILCCPLLLLPSVSMLKGHNQIYLKKPGT